VQGAFSGPLQADRLGLSLAFDFADREGFSRNSQTGNDLDHRSAFSGKAHLAWTPSDVWEARVIVSGERARDGDYALGDLAGLRERPFEVARDFEGRTDRDLFSTTLATRRVGPRLTWSTITGIVRWRTEDLTDLDYTPRSLATRNNLERDIQFTQEVRVASSAAAPVRLSDRVRLQWQAGVFVFTQAYEQDAVNSYSPFLISPLIDFPLDQHVPQAELDDLGVGMFGQATFTVQDRVDVSVGARVDHEQKDATLRTFFTPDILPSTVVDAERGFSSVSPKVSVAFRMEPDRMLYASVGQGFKAGGFNPSSPPGSEVYEEEHAWHLEGGYKSSWAAGRVLANAAVFFIDWRDLQLNVPDPFVPAQFYISNVGEATSRGVELDVAARVQSNVSLFGSVGYTRARFKAASVSRGVDVGGHSLPNTPTYTATLGIDLSRPIRSDTSIFGRAESVFYGSFHYDPSNTAGQDAYALTNLRGGVQAGRLLVEAWVRNLFDRRYVPIAFPYEAFAPSGFLGEPGRPRTFGVTAGVTF
jgi:iron complex outermembrane receptor protein